MRFLLSCFTPTLDDDCHGLISLAFYENKYYFIMKIVANTALSLLVSEVLKFAFGRLWVHILVYLLFILSVCVVFPNCMYICTNENTYLNTYA
jgi:hypothetical protein